MKLAPVYVADDIRGIVRRCDYCCAEGPIAAWLTVEIAPDRPHTLGLCEVCAKLARFDIEHLPEMEVAHG